MLQAHTVVTLAEAKAVCGIRSTDTQIDDRLVRLLEEATAFVESAIERRLLYRGGNEQQLLCEETFASAHVFSPEAITLDAPWTFRFEWSLEDLTTAPSGQITITGLYNAAPVIETIDIKGGNNAQDILMGAAGSTLFDTLTQIEVTAYSGSDQPEMKVYAHTPYRERHTTDGAPEIYVVHRPIVNLVKVEEGYNNLQYSELDAGYAMMNAELGKIVRMANTVGFIDFPEDYFSRFASKSERLFGAWAPDARITYVGGYTSRRSVPAELRRFVLDYFAGGYREEIRADSDLEQQVSNVGASVRKADFRKVLKERMEGFRRLTSSGEGLVAP